MANKEGHRRFGNVRKRASGRWQARYRGPDGLEHSAPQTFDTKRDAERWLTVAEAEIMQGDWVDPLAGNVSVSTFGKQWITDRKLATRTHELYELLFRLHIEPFLGDQAIGELTTAGIRAWRTRLLAAGRSPMTTAKAYRLLRAILNTAVDDEIIKRNPCRIPGADQEQSPERPVAPVPQVYRLAELVPARFRAFVLCAAFSGLRWGELIALRRCDVDLRGKTLRVPRRVGESGSGEIEIGPPKSTAGFRTVGVPGLVIDELRPHLVAYVPAAIDALLFTGERGGVLRRSNFRRATNWPETIVKAGLPAGFHFHDLRHTGNHLAASSGASTRELMQRMGHSSMRAALIYQHATSEREREIARRLGELVERQRHGDDADRIDQDEDGDDGVQAS